MITRRYAGDHAFNSLLAIRLWSSMRRRARRIRGGAWRCKPAECRSRLFRRLWAEQCLLNTKDNAVCSIHCLAVLLGSSPHQFL